MAIAAKLEKYLQQHEIKFKLLTHPHSDFSMETAEKAHVPGDALAKGVLVEDAGNYMLLVLPADYVVELGTLGKLLGREVSMAEEAVLSQVFDDCELGAVPPIGQAYGLKTIWDPQSSLGTQDEVFIEAGDHQNLVKISGEQFHELMATAERAKFGHHM